ncbi:hypothetical protein COW36_12070 [bacterium (Candidatus Blackallbacteria) CG17_big_fil_post_rev_8_21_14_2_50_48_46]|uniref:Transglycosylase SLT domain-containing protein n=1 Tax=bacterium (Candidatus Blackallbacteria) CG17_big_fil_post_rev_8_21_14_2_50_48_46 TaxID=2014261 RepID=A0A2M7G3P8_9BACT|nr:MAG: hypothetical protein COW64_03190 [bacterium (Candidatus Blackallbacteria) CG18_big_fil_WC_8_21_14_2_50_49_26]PIW16496.1 MAG: hypothetical protein COW36_12070 [bacterium (Candidatus Blackallbacteria) CG17_big_fil_post_rev_8_21_14_2_50_48_46]PIW46004.1 MAG: hypothetical protein COW20_17335 [bacterium (Candidatus Blackallbacteria) CG13_big_fil_rev_8_21_14_2_50_49_14]
MGDFFSNISRNLQSLFTGAPTPPRRRQGTPAPQTQPRQPAPPRDQNSAQPRRTANLSRGDVNFPAPAMSPQVKVLYDAIRAYPDNQATEAQAREIATHVDAACRTFQVDPKMLLAILAHESGGFDVDARSHTGAGGLGQLTDSAINETRRLSYDPTYRGPGERQHYPDPDIRAQFERPEIQAIFRRIDQSRANRNNIHDNIWTSTAYARIVMDRADGGRQNAATMGMWGVLGRYNAAGGSEQRAYDDRVAEAYQRMFHQPIPVRVRSD